MLFGPTDTNSLLKKFNGACTSIDLRNYELYCKNGVMFSLDKHRANARLSTVDGRHFWNAVSGDYLYALIT